MALSDTPGLPALMEAAYEVTANLDAGLNPYAAIAHAGLLRYHLHTTIPATGDDPDDVTVALAWYRAVVALADPDSDDDTSIDDAWIRLAHAAGITDESVGNVRDAVAAAGNFVTDHAVEVAERLRRLSPARRAEVVHAVTEALGLGEGDRVADHFARCVDALDVLLALDE